MKKLAADRMLRAELPEYSDVGLPSQAEGEASISKVRQEVKDFISLSVADSKVMLPPKHVVEAVKKAMDTPTNVYCPHTGDTEVRKTVATFLKEFKGIDADPDTEIVVTPGTQMGIFGTFVSLIDPGDEVVLIDPDYSCVEPPARFVDAKVVPAPLRKNNGGYLFDYEALRERVSKNTKLLVFSNPNNPAGILYSKQDLTGIADLANDYDFFVLADELYNRLVYDNAPHYSLATFPGMNERTITLMGISKTESMQGFRTGFAYARKEIAQRISELVRYAVQRAPYYAQKAMEAVLQEPKKYAEERVRIHQEKRDIIVKGLSKATGIKCQKPQGTSYVFPDVSGLGMSSQEFSEQLLRLGKIYVPAGYHFGRNGEGHIRICFACSNQRLENSAETIATVAQRIKK
jgi:aspartate/methionine/tyrosine aminotransferase